MTFEQNIVTGVLFSCNWNSYIDRHPYACFVVDCLEKNLDGLLPSW